MRGNRLVGTGYQGESPLATSQLPNYEESYRRATRDGLSAVSRVIERIFGRRRISCLNLLLIRAMIYTLLAEYEFSGNNPFIIASTNL